MQGITNRAKKNVATCKYINAFLANHGMTDECSSLCINHGASVKLSQNKDAHNLGGSTNHTMSLGSFEGGELWVHDPAARRGEHDVTSHKLGKKTLYIREETCDSQQTG